MTDSEESDRDSPRGHEPPRSSRSQPDCALDILHAPSGKRRFHELSGTRAVIGSSPRAEVCLDDASVSPTHAELVRGPLGQWWIHDLESESGTFIHGHRTQEQLLTVGDEVAIGCFRLRLTRLSSSELPAVLGQPDDEPMHTVRFGSQLPPPRVPMSPPVDIRLTSALGPASAEHPIGAVHLSRLISLTRELTQTDDAAARCRLLCDLLASGDFCVDVAAVVRLTGPSTARVLEGPTRAAGTALPLYLSARMTGTFWETRRAVCYHTRAGDSVTGTGRKSRVVADCPHLTGHIIGPEGGALEPACLCEVRDKHRRDVGLLTHVVLLFPLREDAHSIDGLHVAMESRYWTSEWCTIIALVAESFHQAELVWQMRLHVRQASSVERELEMARQIQQGLVPQQAHFDSLHQQLEVVVGFEPCHWVGGDYADAVRLPDGRVLLAIADVCGKGMQAALVASSLHTFVRATVDLGLPLTELVARINRYMCRYLPDHVFVTMLCVAADLVTGDLEVVSAGHPPALVAEPNGRVLSLDVGHNVGLGLMDANIVSGIHRLGPDQILFLYTDGLTEAVNKQLEPLGIERLAHMFSSAVSLHAVRGTHAMREAMLSSLRGYRGSLLAHDDTTFLLARLRIGGGKASTDG